MWGPGQTGLGRTLSYFPPHGHGFKMTPNEGSFTGDWNHTRTKRCGGSLFWEVPLVMEMAPDTAVLKEQERLSFLF